nr:hypothetical protein [Tanacetum cinerariifolium]
MSVSSLSGASSHAFHPSSVGTSTLDSSEIPIILIDTYVADPAYVVHRENHTKNNTITKIEEGEVDQTSSSSSNASQSSVSQRTEHIIEEFQDPSISTALGNDIAVPATDCNNSNRSSSIIGT